MKHYLPLLSVLVLLGSGCAPASQVATNAPNAPIVQEKPANGTELDLSNRSLSSIPSGTFSRTELTRLDLSGNRLTGAPQAEIRHLSNLKSLDLSDNQLTGLPAELGQLSKLEVLDVSNNQLTGLPMELGKLTQLRVLDVSGNDYSKQDLERIAATLPNTDIRR